MHAAPCSLLLHAQGAVQLTEALADLIARDRCWRTATGLVSLCALSLPSADSPVRLQTQHEAALEAVGQAEAAAGVSPPLQPQVACMIFRSCIYASHSKRFDEAASYETDQWSIPGSFIEGPIPDKFVTKDGHHPRRQVVLAQAL